MELKLQVLGGGTKLVGARRGTFYMVDPSQMLFWDDETKRIYVVKGVDNLGWLGSAGVKLRKVYSLLTGVPLRQINAAVAKHRKQLMEESKENSIRELRAHAETLGFDLVSKK